MTLIAPDVKQLCKMRHQVFCIIAYAKAHADAKTI